MMNDGLCLEWGSTDGTTGEDRDWVNRYSGSPAETTTTVGVACSRHVHRALRMNHASYASLPVTRTISLIDRILSDHFCLWNPDRSMSHRDKPMNDEKQQDRCGEPTSRPLFCRRIGWRKWLMLARTSTTRFAVIATIFAMLFSISGCGELNTGANLKPTIRYRPATEEAPAEPAETSSREIRKNDGLIESTSSQLMIADCQVTPGISQNRLPCFANRRLDGTFDVKKLATRPYGSVCEATRAQV